MDKLLPILRRDFPDYEAIKAFEAAIPVYLIELVVEVLERQRLTTFQSYVLQAVALEVKTDKAIARLLGLDPSDLTSTAVSLLRLGYMQQGPLDADKERPLSLTSLGRQILMEEGPPQVPQRVTGTFHFNALTGRSLPREQNTWQERRMLREGLPLLPKKGSSPPTLGDFEQQEVRQALSTSWVFQGREITDLLKLKKKRLEYLAPVTVVILQHQNGNEQRLVVYRNRLFQQADSEALQELFEHDEFRVPQDAASLQEQEIDIVPSLPAQVRQAIQDLVQSETIFRALETQRFELEGNRLATQNERERERKVGNLPLLQEKLDAQRAVSEELRRRLREQDIVLLRAGEHRVVLEQALKEAREEIIILSQWLNGRACDDSLCQLMGKAMKRGVRISIGYHSGNMSEGVEAGRHRHNIQQVKWALERVLPPTAAQPLDLKEISEFGPKLLICDKAFAVSGGFDWLSNAGQQDESYRNETGLLFRSKDHVTELAQLAVKRFSG